MRYYLKYNGGSFMIRTDASGVINATDLVVPPTNANKGKIIGELVGIVWDKKFPSGYDTPKDAFYLFFTKSLQVSTSDDNGNSIGTENVNGYFYIPWRTCDIVDEKGNVIQNNGKDPETFWRGLFSGWGSGKQWLKSDVAPKEDSFLGQLWFYFLKYWWILLILLFWNTIKGVISDFQKIGKKLMPKR